MSKRQYVDRRCVAEDLHIDVERRVYLARAAAILVDAKLAITFDRLRGSAEQPQELERIVDAHLAGVLDGAAERQRVTFASEHGKLVEARRVAQHLRAWIARAGVEVVPRAGRQRDVDVAALANDRCDEQRIAEH